MWLLPICIDTWEICLFKSFPILKSVCCCVVELLDFKIIFWLLTPFQIYDLQIFSSILCLLIHAVDSIILAKALNFDVSNLSIFSYVTCTFGVIVKKSLPNLISWSFDMFSSKSFMMSALTFRSLGRFEIIFVSLSFFKAEGVLHIIDVTSSVWVSCLALCGAPIHETWFWPQEFERWAHSSHSMKQEDNLKER